MLGRIVTLIILCHLTLSKEGAKPLFSIGQDILAAHKMGVSSFLQQLGGPEYRLIEWASTLKYGLTQHCTTGVAVPFLSEEFSRVTLKGLGNITFGIEYSIADVQESDAAHKWTALGCILLPTAAKKSDPTARLVIGNDSVASLDIDLAQPTTSYVLGTTFDHVSENYYFSGVWNVLLQTNTANSMYRPTLCCNIALGRILHLNHELAISILIEMNTRFRPSTSVNGIINDRSGSYRLWLGPSLDCTYKELKIRAGFQYPVIERFFAPRIVPNYRIAFEVCLG